LVDIILNLENKVVEHVAVGRQELSCLEGAMGSILIKLDNLNAPSGNGADFGDVGEL
jgi:hypothetical protein